MRKLILYIACSLDGYIAKPNDDLSFLDKVQVEGMDYGYHDFIATVDTIIMGRRTYDWVVNEVGSFPDKERDIYIITRTAREFLGNIQFYTEDVGALIRQLKEKDGKNIFCDGGAQLVNSLMKEKLFDELIISIVPVLLGDGTKLFQDGRPERDLELISSTSYDSGLVQLRYKAVGQ
ncbi:MAG: dihydrofolate reductase [Bacteroidetes bacterium]|nr:dihydrofolate reductase [Bacteroidota bacterium]